MAEKREDEQTLDEILKDNLAQIEVLKEKKAHTEAKVDEAIKEAENTAKKVAKAKKELKEIAPLVNDVKTYAGNCGRDADILLPEAGKFETGKNYREKKALPFVKKIQNILFSLYHDHCQLHDKYQQLVRDYNSIWDRRQRLRQRYDVLEQRVEELEVVEKDYGRIRKVFGSDRIDGLLREMKEQERVETEIEKEKWKKTRNKQRDAR